MIADDIRNLAKWLNEEQTAELDRQALARVLAYLQHSPAAPVQEPEEWDERCVLGHCGSPTGCELSNRCRADNTPAAQRQSARSAWVRLDKEEIEDIAHDSANDNNPWCDIAFARAIEAKLRERNGGQA